jgi:hypothetical protein
MSASEAKYQLIRPLSINLKQQPIDERRDTQQLIERPATFLAPSTLVSSLKKYVHFMKFVNELVFLDFWISNLSEFFDVLAPGSLVRFALFS